MSNCIYMYEGHLYKMFSLDSCLSRWLPDTWRIWVYITVHGSIGWSYRYWLVNWLQDKIWSSKSTESTFSNKRWQFFLCCLFITSSLLPKFRKSGHCHLWIMVILSKTITYSSLKVEKGVPRTSLVSGNKNCSFIVLCVWSMSCKDHLRSLLPYNRGKHLRGKYFYPSSFFNKEMNHEDSRELAWYMFSTLLFSLSWVLTNTLM